MAVPRWANSTPILFAGRVWPDTGPDQVGQPAVGAALYGKRGGWLGHASYTPRQARMIGEALLRAADVAEHCPAESNLDQWPVDVRPLVDGEHRYYVAVGGVFIDPLDGTASGDKAIALATMARDELADDPEPVTVVVTIDEPQMQCPMCGEADPSQCNCNVPEGWVVQRREPPSKPGCEWVAEFEVRNPAGEWVCSRRTFAEAAAAAGDAARKATA